MAKPKVFIGSTCYDLREVRDSLSTFIGSYGFEPILSERGDVFYNSELHTHDACLEEVYNCQLFVLIIGGRSGGQYLNDKSLTITNAEYEVAVTNRIPIFTYVQRNVLDNHHTYITNKHKKIVNDIHFPAIDVQEQAQAIFSFIDRVRLSPTNNGYEPFETSANIESHLRKQLAGMFFNLLKNRDSSQKISQTEASVSVLKKTTERLEDIIKHVYIAIDQDEARKIIRSVERLSIARDFFDQYISGFRPGHIFISRMSELDRLASIDPKKISWIEYLVALGVVEEKDTERYIFYEVPEAKFPDDIDSNHYFDLAYAFGIDKTLEDDPDHAEARQLYIDGVCALSAEERHESLRKYVRLSTDFESDSDSD